MCHAVMYRPPTEVLLLDKTFGWATMESAPPRWGLARKFNWRIEMLAKINNAFVRMGQCGLYARPDYGENAAAATPSILGKAIRLARQGSNFLGVVVYSTEDKEEFSRTGRLKIHFAPLTP